MAERNNQIPQILSHYVPSQKQSKVPLSRRPISSPRHIPAWSIPRDRSRGDPRARVSSSRRRAGSIAAQQWIPAFAGMTARGAV